MKDLLKWIPVFAFWGFVAGKLVGGYISTWSWWWLLMPLVPWLGTAIHRFVM